MVRLRLRSRLLLSFLLTVFLPASMFALISFTQILKGIADIEVSKLQEGLTRTMVAIEGEGSQISANVQDYAHWDEMFYPETGRDPEWQRVNITIWIPDQFDIDVIWLADLDGNVYYQHNTPDEFQQNVRRFALFKSALSGENTHALMQTSGGLMLAASAFVSPALVPNDFDPATQAAGVLFYGRYIDNEVAERISSLTGQDIEFFDKQRLIATSLKNRHFLIGRPVQETSTEAGRVLITERPRHVRNHNTHAIYATLYDVNNQLAAAVGVIKELNTESFVRARLYSTYVWSLIMMACVAGVLAYCFGTRIANIVKKLTTQIKSYARGDLHHPIEVTRSDELGELQQSFADLIQSLEQAKVRIQEQEMTILDIIELSKKQEKTKQKDGGKPPVKPKGR